MSGYKITAFLAHHTSASVDLETDKKIQYTIQTEFKDRTLICIARRSPRDIELNY